MEVLITGYGLADSDSIRSSIATIEQQWGELDVLVNNAAPMDVSAPAG